MRNLDSDKTFYFSTFDSADNYYKQTLDSYEQNAPAELKQYYDNQLTADKKGVRASKQDFLGTDNANDLIYENIDTFINPQLIQDVKSRFEGVLDKIDMGGAFEKDRLIATRDKNGIFDFGLASKGLMRPAEYYSDKLAQDHPYEFKNYGEPSGVVPSDFVMSKTVNKIIIFWYNKDGKDYLLEQRQIGVTKSLLQDPKAKTRKMGSMTILEKFNKNLKFTSNYEKCYLKHKYSGGKAKTVDIFVPMGGSFNLNPEQLAFNCFPAFLAAEILEEAGIKTRISVAYTFETINKRNVLFNTYPIKDYGQDFDWNNLMIHVADPRMFRWNGFKSQAGALLKDFPRQKNGRRWSNAAGLENGYILSGDLFFETFERYKKYALNLQAQGSSNLKTLDRNKMIYSAIPRSWTLDKSTQDEVDERILTEFNRIMDTIDMEFNDTSKVAKRVYEREESNKTQFEIIDYLKTLVDNAYSLPKRNEYAADADEIAKNEELASTKKSKVDSYFN